MNKILEVKDLAITFNTYAGRVQAVRGVSFDLYGGETLALVGESGSGKSVTNRAIMGLLAKTAEVESGSICYKDRDLLGIGEKEWEKLRGRDIAMIFQDPMSSLNPVTKVGKQITEIYTKKHKLPKTEATKKAVEMMESVGIANAEKRYHQYPFQFSGGMRQRIVIAIALASSPEILICDEPTTALDVTIQAQVLKLITNMKREKGLSIIFITHDLGVVAHMADRVAVMYAGKIVEYGTAREIFYDPRHPYTWSLMASVPDIDFEESGKLYSIKGTPPNMLHPPEGDAFAERNPSPLEIDYIHEPPFFKVSDTHYAATWLLHPDAPKVEMPESLKARIGRSRTKSGEVTG